MPQLRPHPDDPPTAVQRASLEERDGQIATRAAWMYFIEDRTQAEIAEHLGLTRMRVNRLLSLARESGLVQFQITRKLRACVELENALRDRFGLGDAHVVPSPLDPASTRAVVAMQAGALLSDRLRPEMTVAVGWGRTLRASLRAMDARAIPDLEIVSLIGGLMRGSVMNAYETALRLADMFDARCTYVAGPAFADSEETRDLLLRQGMIEDALARARRADVAYISVGALHPASSMATLGLVTPEDIATLARAGAVGDLLGYWIDANGALVDHPINRRVLALPIEDLRAIPSVILATGGPGAEAAVRAALLTCVVDCLVTDERTAAAICAAPAAAGAAHVR
jgi:DNA-binding transcriptional regulator LsrR (DeoR family)